MLTKDTSEAVEYYTPNLGFDVSAYIKANDMQGTHHVGRYQWAVLALAEKKPRVVVDIACGAGYGSLMIARGLPDARVIGVDYDARAAEYAKNIYRSPNLFYTQGDITTWKSNGQPMERCDTIVSFDTIEHLPHREIALMRMADALTDDGWLLFSTPCGHQDTQLLPPWEHHKIEYSHVDLFALLSRFFRRVTQPQDCDFPAADFWSGRVNAGQMRYLNRMNPVLCQDPIRPLCYMPRA